MKNNRHYLTDSNRTRFERFVASVYSSIGYKIETNKIIGELREVDIIASKENEILCIEVKTSTLNDRVFGGVKQNAVLLHAIPVVVVGRVVEDSERQIYKEKFSDVQLIDVANLKFIIGENGILENNLMLSLDYSINPVTPKAPSYCMIGNGYSENLNDNTQKNGINEDIDELLNNLNECVAGREDSRDYEYIMQSILQLLFADEIASWKPQRESNQKLYKFDLLCRISDCNNKPFWGILEKYFVSKYIVFEFKNLSKDVTQKEIYSTEKYLYSKALRRVAIMITRHGYEENAIWAAKGALRENGKLILLLTDEDIIKMCEMKKNEDDPNELLMEKLDDWLVELEK